MGAAGQLLVAGEVKQVLPADNAELLRLGFPLRDRFTEADKEHREDERVRRIVAAGESPAGVGSWRWARLERQLASGLEERPSRRERLATP